METFSADQQLLRLITDQLPIIVWTTDRDLRFTSCLGAGLFKLGLEPHELEGMLVAEYVRTNDPGFEPVAMHLAALNGESVCRTLEWEGRTYLVRVEPLRGESRAIIGCLGVADDITEQHSLTDQLRSREAFIRSRLNELETLYRTAPVGLAMLDLDRRYVRVNEQFAQMLGRQVETIVGRHVGDVAPEVSKIADELHQRVIDTGEPLFEHEYQSPLSANGQLRQWLVSYSPLKSTEGKTTGLILVVQDITERRQAEMAARHLAAIVESSDLAMMGISLEGTILSLNAAAETLYGYTPEELIGRSCELIVPEDRRHESIENHRLLLRGEPVSSHETVRRHKDGSLIDVALTLSPIRDHTGAVVAVSAISHDITEHKTLERDYARLVSQLAHSARLMTLGEMASSLAHELNQPLTAIGIHASVCQNLQGATPQDQNVLRTSLEEIAAQSERASNIIRTFRNWSRKSHIQRSPLVINEHLQHIVKFMRHELHNHGIAIKLNLASNLPSIVADGTQVGQVLVNLIRNAIDAIDRGRGADREIEISTCIITNDRVRVSVSDSGDGLGDIEDLNQLFESFYTRNPEGIGLGLSICKRIVELHGGRIWAECRPERGAVFYFDLPISLPVTEGSRP